MFRSLLIISISLCVTALSAGAQQLAPGNIEIVQDSRIGNLITKHIYIGENGKLEGFRVQIFYDSGNNSKNRAFAKKGQFLAQYPEVGAYLSFQTPNYKVRVGDFRTRMDAEGFKVKISGTFTDAFVVKDEINYPDL
jgi:hypothetical protein